MSQLELHDIQGIIARGYGNLDAAAYVLLHVEDAQRARAWLGQLADLVHTSDERPNRDRGCLNIAFTYDGLVALGLDERALSTFATEFQEGITEPNRSRILGDYKPEEANNANDPQQWLWGGTDPQQPKVHILLLLFAVDNGQLDQFYADLAQQFAQAGVELILTLDTYPLKGGVGEFREHFGFRDAISQPSIEGIHPDKSADNLIKPGEFILGYPNEYGLLTESPRVSPGLDPQNLLPPGESGAHDLGRNGSYLVFRQLGQKVEEFWRFLEQISQNPDGSSNPETRLRLAAKLVGRWPSGTALVQSPDRDDPTVANKNDFAYHHADAQGLRCPFGAHIRRSNPRDSLDPGPGTSASIAINKTHRLLRRGRTYGAPISESFDPETILQNPTPRERGIHFICINADISRQFEFVQHTWLNNPKFNGLYAETDPLVGDRLPGTIGITDTFTIPESPLRQRIKGLPQFVIVRGGAYFFLPGIRAIRYLASIQSVGANPTPLFSTTMTSTSNPEPQVNASRPVPPPNTGSFLMNGLSNLALFLTQFERRFDPFFRPVFDALFRGSLTRLTTALINLLRPNEGLKLAEEKPILDEAAHVDSIISSFQDQMRALWKPGRFERGGNTKTFGIVRGEFIIHDNLPEPFCRGIYAQPQTFKAWVRFSGPGPYITPDIDDVGVMSISIKLLGVPGPKLMADEKFTLDMFGVSTPTFVTPDVGANAHLQIESFKNAQLFHFLNFRQPHLLDLIMQGLWAKTQSSPLEAPYFSCVPYLLGEGQAMQYSVWPKAKKRTPIPRLPLRPPDDYLRQAMVTTLAKQDVEFDIRLQLQTDPHLMPIENAAVYWPERLSPRVSVATLRIPKQTFDSPTQLDFAKRLSYNPWHTIAEHRPLGNQNRARRRMYEELLKLRQRMNDVSGYEPTGDESFED